MFKREWTVFGILAGCSAAVTIFAAVYKRSDGAKVKWLTYVAIVAIVVTLAFLALLLYLNAKNKFDGLLARDNFVAQKQYVWGKQKLLIDFDSQRIANTYISIKPIVSFDEVANFRIETYHIGERAELPEDQCFVSLVIAVKKEGFEDEYLYIPAYEVQVSAEDVSDIKQISQELVAKYPELEEVAALQSDVKKILEINAAKGIHYNIRND